MTQKMTSCPFRTVIVSWQMRFISQTVTVKPWINESHKARTRSRLSSTATFLISATEKNHSAQIIPNSRGECSHEMNQWHTWNQWHTQSRSKGGRESGDSSICGGLINNECNVTHRAKWLICWDERVQLVKEGIVFQIEQKIWDAAFRSSKIHFEWDHGSLQWCNSHIEDWRSLTWLWKLSPRPLWLAFPALPVNAANSERPSGDTRVCGLTKSFFPWSIYRDSHKIHEYSGQTHQDVPLPLVSSAFPVLWYANTDLIEVSTNQLVSLGCQKLVLPSAAFSRLL